MHNQQFFIILLINSIYNHSCHNYQVISMGARQNGAQPENIEYHGNNIRFQDHMPLVTNQVITHNISVKDTSLYFQPYVGQRIADLSTQYQTITQQKLNLNIEKFELQKDLPLIIFSKQKSQYALQNVLNYSPQKKLSEMEIKSLHQEIYTLKRVIEDYRKQNEFQVNIVLINFSLQPIDFDFLVRTQTTWRDIIYRSCSRYDIQEYSLEQIFIEIGYSYQKINQEFYNQRISETDIKWNQQSPQIIITYLSNKCFFVGNSQVISRSQMQIDRFPTENISRVSIYEAQHLLNNDKPVHVSSLNTYKDRIQISSIKIIKRVQHPQYIHHIFAIANKEIFQIQCSKDALFFNRKHRWTAAQNLDVGDLVYGVDRQNQLTIFKIVKNKIRQLNMEERCYCLSSPKFNNIVLNQFILHNKNPIKIQVHEVSDITWVRQIEVYRDMKLSQVFGDRRCEIVGNKLKNQANIGDYVFTEENIIYVYDQQGKEPQNLIISERNQKNISYFDLSPKERGQLCDKWKNDYLGITANNIVSLNEEDFEQNVVRLKIKHMIVEKRGSFQKFNYSQNIQPKYRPYEDNSYNTHKNLVSSTGNRGSLDAKSFIGIKLYTQNNIFGSLNKFLYATYGKSVRDEMQYRKWFAMTGWISKSLEKLPNYEGEIYRGMKNTSLQYYLGLVQGSQNETITLSAFTSGSINKSTAKGFSNQAGCIIKMKVSRGKLIQKFSAYPTQREVLLAPFTQFVILNYNLQSRPQTATLEQLPMPKITSDKILYWVDDKPSGNRSISKQKFEPNGIEVIEIKNTKVMAVILKKYFWMLKIMGKKVVIISDMSRFQNDAWNSEAGVELFNLIYNTYSLSNKAIIYTMDLASARRKFEEHGVNKSNWIITNNSQEIVAAVLEEFRRV